METLWGVTPAQLHQHLHQLGPRQAADFLRTHNGQLHQLSDVQALLSSEKNPLIYEGKDEFRERKQDCGIHDRPGDSLDAFNHVIRKQLNESAAIAAVVNRPRDLTRQQLREIRLPLDNAGFSEANLQSAWKDKTNEELASSVIGFIRQAALGEPRVPIEGRGKRAMQRILSKYKWHPVQKKWLDRLAKRLTHEVVVDKDFINERFSSHGGLKQLDRVLDHHLDDILESLNDELSKPPVAQGQ